MLDYLDKLRKKPRHVRERIALLTTAVLSLLIVSVWWQIWSAERMNDAARVSADISPVTAVLSIAGRAKESTQGLLSELVESVKIASSTADVAQVGNAFEVDWSVESLPNMIDNTTRVDEGAATEGSSTSVE